MATQDILGARLRGSTTTQHKKGSEKGGGVLRFLKRSLQKVLRRVLGRCLVVGSGGTKSFQKRFLEAGFPEGA